MKEESSFPDWFKNIFIVFGFIFLIEFISNCYASYVPYIILSYPIILLWILQYEKSPEENGKSGKGIYFFNISLCIIALFTIILLVNYKYYIEHAGKFFIGGNTFLITDNYNLKIALYIFGILYFVFASIYLSNRIKFWIESYEGIGDFQIGKKIWNDINLPIHKGQNLGALRNTEFVKSQIKEALKFFDKAIEKGVVESELYSLRGNCLNDLEYYIDALDDYDKAIEGNPKHGIASNYHMRSMIKDTIFDYEGSIKDIEEAIRLSKLDNDDNEFWDKYAVNYLGMKTATQFYEMQKELVIRKLEQEKIRPIDRISELKKFKSR